MGVRRNETAREVDDVRDNVGLRGMRARTTSATSIGAGVDDTSIVLLCWRSYEALKDWLACWINLATTNHLNAEL